MTSLPIIRIIEGSGGGGSVKTIETKGAANLPGGIGGTRAYWYTTANMARVPVVGLGLGSVAGLGAARLAASHYSVMTKNSAMFVAGPPVVKRLGQDLTKQELGGADIQTRAAGARSTRCVPSSTPWSTRVRSSRSAPISAVPSSPDSRGWRAEPCCCSP